MADYLSGHTFPYGGTIIKSEQMFNDQFTINVLGEFTNKVNETIRPKAQQPIGNDNNCNSESEATKTVLTVIKRNDSETQDKISSNFYKTNKLCKLANMTESSAQRGQRCHGKRSEAADVWLPRIHREIVERANNCPQCCAAGKNRKCLKSQKGFGKLPGNETSIDFAGSFKNPRTEKKTCWYRWKIIQAGRKHYF